MADAFHLRVCYRKTGRLRYLSHLEVARACERAARRAGLPYAVSQGFTPRVRMSFGPALPVGSAGEREYYDIALREFIRPERACELLGSVTVTELAPIVCGYVSGREKSLAASLTIATYDVIVRGGIPQRGIGQSLATAISAGKLSVEHKGKEKVFDLTEALPKEPEVVSAEGESLVRLTVRMNEQGSLRPEVFLASALGPEVRLAVTRTDLLIEDAGGWHRPL